MKTRILLADDHAVLRAGLRLLLNGQPDMEVCGEAADGDETLRKVRELRPDVVLMDLRMPGMDGIEATRQITALMPEVKVLVLSMYDDVDYLERALAAGAAGYALKRSADTELLAAIRSVSRGEVFADPRFTKALVERLMLPEAARRQEEPEEVLSPREQEVLRLLAYGHTNQQIADMVGLSVKTVESYKARIMEKLGLQGRAALVRYALDKGILSPDQ